MNKSSHLALVLGSLAFAACSSQSGAGGMGAPDASLVDANDDAAFTAPDSASTDGPADLLWRFGPDSASMDAAEDALPDAAPCPSIADVCMDGGPLGVECVESWSTAEMPSAWCPKFPYVRVIPATNCDGFDIVVLGATDTSTFYYYDPQGGALVGIEGHGNFGARCIAGQSPDVPLADCFDSGGAPAVACLADGGVGP